jgi:hypothetical protein
LLTLTTFLTSCSTVQKLDVFATEVTSDNAQEVFAKMQEQGKDPVLFGLSDDDYELLSKNFAQIRAYMIQQGLTLEQYREYYEPKEETGKENAN